MASEPNFSDSCFNLWFKIATNFYEAALAGGATGLIPPSMNDSLNQLQRKAVAYTAEMV